MQLKKFFFFTLCITGALSECENLEKPACLKNATCVFTTPKKSNKYRSFCTTIPQTCASAANVKNGGSLPVGVSIGTICRFITAENCVFQPATRRVMRRKKRIIRPAACVKEPEFPVACSGAAEYANIMSLSLKDTCAAIPDCIFRVKKNKKGRVVLSVCEDAPAPPTTCALAQKWANTYSQSLQYACNASVQTCDFYAAVRNRRKIVRPARCEPTTTLAPTNAPTTPPPTPVPCNPTKRCDKKYVCVKLNRAGNNACASKISACGRDGVLYQNVFCD